MQVREKGLIRIAAPSVVIHRLVAGGANAGNADIGTFGAGEHGRDPVGELDPGIGGVKDSGVGAEAMEDFAEKPFAAVDATALGEILRAKLARERSNFSRLSGAGVILPQPRERGGV